METLPQTNEANTQPEVNDDRAESLMKLVTFTLGEEVYGIDIMSLREIRVWADTTSLPNTPSFVMGVINLRGVIVPVFDLRDRFGRGLTKPTKTHAVIIVAVDSRTIGILVDTVSDIIDLDESDIRPVPEMEYKQESEYLSGLATVNNQMVSLIAADRLFNKDIINALSGPMSNGTSTNKDTN